MKVLVDSSFLLFCADRGVDYLSVIENKLGERLELVAPSSVVEELRRLAAKSGRKSSLARVALKILKNAEHLPGKPGEKVDDVLLQLVRETGYPVLTVDARLMRRLAARNLEYMGVSAAGKPIVRLKFR
ncbi:MAG: hypothetical protein QXN23_04920 [Candidatus Caldarchaeum sp.]|uniref:PIN domain-containing protein n=1 Tax=Caldiarchaeum subterraneum TaxID=311458 RepID=A0A7C4E234_CALS0|nr:hypothetical protein [Candidatus Caldarchaeales archaeon]MDJ0272907.1 hypothetical protein [Candidatus Caldarchaeales archaeon]